MPNNHMTAEPRNHPASHMRDNSQSSDMVELREAISREVFAGIIDPQNTDTVVQSCMIADAILALPGVASRRPARPASDAVEIMGEALFNLSDSLRESLSNDRLHARYEAVVAAWEALTDALSIEASHHAELVHELAELRCVVDKFERRMKTDGQVDTDFALIARSLMEDLAKIGGAS